MKKRTSMNYSMTKKQRKNMSNNTDKNSQSINSQPQLSEEEKSALEEQKAAKKTRTDKIKRTTTLIVSIILSVALVAAAITVPLVVSYNTPPKGNPIAKIHLSNGMTLEYELFLDKAPIATTNFIFLTKIGFYDNTLIHDIGKDGWIRFDGYEQGSDYKSHRAENVEFARSVNKYFKKYNIEYFRDKSLNGVRDYENDCQIFNYRLRSESTGSASLNSADIIEGDLAFMRGYESTGMQIAVTSNPNMTEYKAGSPNNFTQITRFGRYNNDETLENIKQLAEYTTVINNDTYFKHPQQEIVITKIEITNLFKKEWNKLLNDTGLDVYLDEGIDASRSSYSTHTGYTSYSSYK